MFYCDAVLMDGMPKIFSPTAPIGMPTNITAVTFDSTSIHIDWVHPPEDTHYGVIREYRLNLTELETGTRTRVVVNSNRTEVVFGFLHPYFTYHITIVPVTVEEGQNYTEITIRTEEDGKTLACQISVEKCSVFLGWIASSITLHPYVYQVSFTIRGESVYPQVDCITHL